jgi:hypothetical protein
MCGEIKNYQLISWQRLIDWCLMPTPAIFRLRLYQNIDNSECVGVQLVKIYPEMTSQ